MQINVDQMLSRTLSTQDRGGGGAELPLRKCSLGLPFRIHTDTFEAAAGLRL